MADETLLRRLVVVRRHRQDALHAEILELTGKVRDLLGVVAAGARQHGRPPAGLLEHQFHHARVLLVREGGTLARRAAGHDEVHPLVDLPARQAAHGGLVNTPAARERRHERGANAGP